MKMKMKTAIAETLVSLILTYNFISLAKRIYNSFASSNSHLPVILMATQLSYQLSEMNSSHTFLDLWSKQNLSSHYSQGHEIVPITCLEYFPSITLCYVFCIARWKHEKNIYWVSPSLQTVIPRSCENEVAASCVAGRVCTGAGGAAAGLLPG